MKKILFLLLIIPMFLFSQETKKDSSNQQKVDGYSGATMKKEETPKFKGNISGKVKNSQDEKALEFATVSLISFKTNTIVEGTITDAKGRFYFNNVTVGKYNITINFIGFKEKTIIAETSNKKPDFKANNIILDQSSELLSEVNIEEDKAIYETRIDKIVYNAEHDLNESENDATDVLRKAPLLSVDLDGNVSLRGSRNIKFLVNGKASSFFSSDVATALQMIPADQIKTVEVITSPGAKYDGEGDAGIVNIITKKSIIDGYNATINTMIGTKVTRSGLNLNFGKGRFGLSARANIYGSWPGRIGTDTYTRSDWDSINMDGNPVNPNILTQDGKSENYYQGLRGSINTFYDVNAYNSFNSSFKFGGTTSPFENSNTAKYIHGTDSLLSYTSDYVSLKTSRALNMEWTTDYTKKFAGNENRELTLAFQLGGDINDGDTDIDENERILFNQNDEKVIEETLQLDYTHPFGSSKRSNKIKSNNKEIGRGKGYGRNREKGGSGSTSNSNKIEIGGKIINRDREMVYSNQLDDIYQNAEAFNYNQLVTSSYLSTEFSLPHGLGLKTGFRYENTKTSGDWRTKPDSTFEKSYGDLLPSFVFSKSFSPMRSIKFSYNQRIRRPSVKHINTNEDKLDNRNITIGNPDLKPTKTEQYELSINSFGRILQASTQLYYKHSFNVIELFLNEIDEEGVSISKYKNIGESRQIGGSFFGSINLNKLSFRGSLDLYNYSGRDASLGYEEWTTPVLLYSYFMGGSYDLGKNWKAETFGFFRSPTQTIQGSVTSFSMMSFGIKRTFKNKRGSIGVRIIEPFQKNKEFTSDLEGDYFSQSSLKTIPFRSFGISFKYTIGKLNFKEAKNKTNIKNDDIQQEESGEF